MSCAWKTDMAKLLRVLIWDLAEPVKYTDARLEDVLIVAAYQTLQDIPLDVFYSVNLGKVEISPDPSIAPDTAFMNFTTLRAACLVDQGNLRAEAFKEGIRVVLGPTQLSVANHLTGFKTLLELGPCHAYQELRKQYLFGDRVSVRAVLSPFVSNKFDPEYLALNIGPQYRRFGAGSTGGQYGPASVYDYF